MPANAQAISNTTDWISLIFILLVTNWSSEELINLTIAQWLLIHLPTPSAPHHLLSGRETKHQVQLPGKCQLVLCISDYALGFLVLSWFIWPRFLGLTKVERINHQDGLICFPFLWATTEILTCYCADCLLPTLQYFLQSNPHTTISDFCHAPWRGDAFLETAVSNCRKWAKMIFSLSEVTIVILVTQSTKYRRWVGVSKKPKDKGARENSESGPVRSF